MLVTPDRPVIQAPEVPIILPARVAVAPSSAPLPDLEPTPRNRQFRPDLTGLWEATVSGKNNAPALLVQINQAGAALAIWFSRPPAGSSADPLALPKGAGTTVDWTYGVANGFLVDKGVLDANGPTLLNTRDGVALSWMATKTADPFNPLDPSMLIQPPANVTVFEGNGMLRFSQNDANVLVMAFGIGGTPAVMLVRYLPIARLPRTVLNQLAEPLRTQMMLDQVRWIPAAMQANLLSLFAPEFNGGGEPRIAARLRAWRKAEGHQQQALRREEIAHELQIDVTGIWRDRMLDLLMLHARTNSLTVGGDTMTYAGWMLEVLAQERADGTTGGHANRSADIQQAFERLSLGDADFAYVLHFSEIGAKGPKLGFGLGFYGVLVDVTKYRLVFHRDRLTGSIVRDGGGLPVVERRDPVRWDTNTDLIGVFGRLDAGVTNQPKSSVAEATADLGTVEFRSTLDLRSCRELSGAWFTVSSVVVGKAKFGNWASGSAVDSALWEMHIPGHVVGMTAIVDADPIKSAKISNWGSFVTRTWWKNWVPKTIEFTYGRVSMGAGTLLAAGSDPLKTREPQIVRDITASLVGTAQVLFEYESADLDVLDASRVTTGRTRCEMALAEARGLITAPDALIAAIAMTSPEGTKQRNAVLSLNRARAVVQSMFDAFGALITGVPAVQGLGEAPAVLSGLYLVADVMLVGGGLPDPEDAQYPNRAAFFASRAGATSLRWPAWRRVDIVVDGAFAIRYRAADPVP